MSLMKLQKMIDSGEQFVYRDQIAIFKSFENKRGIYEIVVDLNGTPNIFNKQDEKKIELWLANFQSANFIEESNPPPETFNAQLPAYTFQPVVPAIYSENKEVLTNLSKVLLSDIEKVRDDPTYVHQAKQICNSVNAIVNITRLQLQLLKINQP